MHHRSSVRWKWLLFAAALILGVRSPALAVIQVTACGTTCTSNCVLANDITCYDDDPPAVTLLNGADLDMQGHNIGCFYRDGDQSQCDTGLLAYANSMVWSSVGPTPFSDSRARLEGRWRNGILCSGASTRVSGIEFRGNYSLVAIQGCQTVDNNTLAGVPRLSLTGFSSGLSDPPYGIIARTAAGSNVISHNYVDGFVNGIYRGNPGAGTLTIDSNTINIRKDAVAGIGSGINLGAFTDRPATVTNNIFTGYGRASPISVIPAHAPFTYSNNVCKHPLPGCADCIASGQCQASGVCVSP